MSVPMFEQVRTIAADVFQVASQQLTRESAPIHVAAWDSVQHLNLVLALEERFGLQFAPEEIDAMENLGAIAALLEQKTAGARQEVGG